MIRVGLVDFDTSHVVAFTQRLNHLDVDASDRVDGARVVAGCPGESAMMPERIPGYRDQLQAYGIELVDRPQDLIGRVDAVMVESQQGSRHLERARPFIEAGIPTFVDKPFAETVAQAEELIGTARRHGVPLMSCSALRYDPKVTQAKALCADRGRVLSAEVWTAAAVHPGNPGLLHYGIHGAEVLYTLLGPGCRALRCFTSPEEDIVVALWDSGHRSVLRGIRAGNQGFGLAAHYERGQFVGLVEGAAFYSAMLREVVRMFETGTQPIDPLEMRGIVAFCQAALHSADHDGATVEVA